jgi:TRAP-type C4-dicarboxylate transport system substrate-binding protein
MLQAGVLDMSDIQTGWNAGHWPDLSLMDMPCLFSSPDQLYEAYMATWDVWERELEKRFGVHLVMAQLHDEQVVITKMETTTVEDLKGQKIRSFNALLDAIIEALGASAIYIPYGEQYSALQRGVVDGACTGAMSHLAMKHYEVAKYMIYGLGLGGFAPHFVAVSDKRWKELPDDLKQILLDTGQEWTALAPKVIYAALDDTYNQLREGGVTATKVTDEEAKYAAEVATGTVWKDWYNNQATDVGRGMFDLIRYALSK